MAKTVNEKIADHFRALAALYADLEDVEPVEVDEDAEDVERDAPSREEIESLGLKELRTTAKEYGIEETKKADILAAFEDLYDEDDEDDEDEDEDLDDEDEEEDDEDDEDEDGEYDRDDLEDLTLKELRVLAKEEGNSASEIKGADKDALIDMILGEEDEDEEEDEDDDDEDVEELDEDALNAMTQRDLIALANELDIKVPKALQKSSKSNHAKLVDLILDSGEED